MLQAYEVLSNPERREHYDNHEADSDSDSEEDGMYDIDPLTLFTYIFGHGGAHNHDNRAHSHCNNSQHHGCMNWCPHHGPHFF